LHPLFGYKVFRYLHFTTHTSAAAFLCLLILIFTAASFTACIEKPGEGKQAQQGFAAADPIINALENYKNEQGKYPARLSELVPQYLEKDPQKDDKSEIRFVYYPAEESTSYSLRLSYPTIFGADECRYTPAEKRWTCGGAM
jgi:hypothetical protein